MRHLDHLYTLCRWALGSLFIYAGARKLLDPNAFAVLLDAFGIVPESLLGIVAALLPLAEVVAGLALLFDIRGSLAVVAGLLVIFSVMLGYGLKMGLNVDCGCFGPQDPEARAFHGLDTSFYRDLAMLAIVVGLYGWRRWRGIRPVKPAALSLNRSRGD
jgi:uncharacterized membrane protein YphA (DoxX/SURF4 family)